MPIIKNLVLEGGGIKGVAYVGSIQALHELEILDDITGFAGSSAGAITAGLLAVKYPVNNLQNILRNTDFNKFKDDSIGITRDTMRFFKDFGIYKGDYFLKWYSNLLKEHTGIENITFKQANDKYKTVLKITASNLNKQKIEIYDHLNTPDMTVQDAVRASMSIPLFFKCVRNKENDVIVDGGMLNNYPINLFDNELDKTIGLKLMSHNEINEIEELDEITNIHSYIKSLIGTLLEQIEKLHVKKQYWRFTISINTGNIKTTQFNLTEEDKEFLIINGYTSVMNYFKKSMSYYYSLV